MRTAHIFINGIKAGQLIEHDRNRYEFNYDESYKGAPVSLTLPLSHRNYQFTSFPAFFEGLLPEGFQLEALLKDHKINRQDYFKCK
ncbi:MAG: HipA N-terminal domain-containing protein [Deltaproteobacteria bacterium]|jgi:serine/threonine-protein kinase HipA|nr:HipA N-terminal domain-containing protein [Deltaproteobacteria bacterium]